jgi:hypothetical protein
MRALIVMRRALRVTPVRADGWLGITIAVKPCAGIRQLKK